MSLPDYSEWLDYDRLEVEERLWAECGYYKWYAAAVQKQLPANGCVIEFGAGTAWVPTVVKGFSRYVCVDKNANCIQRGWEKHNKDESKVAFRLADVRTFGEPVVPYDVACAFAFFKHFGLAEVEDVIAKVLRCGFRGAFTIPPADTDIDDGIEFPHTRLSQETIYRAVEAAGHEPVKIETLPNEELLVFTVVRA